MKKFIIAAFSIAFLAGCVTTADINSQIKQVQDYTRLACSYLPTVSTVAAILSRSAAIESTVAIADQICSAVTNLPLAEGPGRRQAVVKGVVVRGRFVR